MSKFKFRLQSVIKVKEIQEKRVERELAMIKKKILLEQARIDDLRAEQDKLVSESPLQGKVKAADIAVHQVYLKKISDEIHFQNAKIAVLSQSESKKIDEVLDVKKDKEAIEHLRERQLEDYKREMDKKEQVLIDAVAQRLMS